MALKNRLLKVVNSLLSERLDLQVVSASEVADLRAKGNLLDKPSFGNSTLPEGAEEYLRLEHPRLMELKAKAKALNHPAAQHSQWSDQYVASELDLRYFRGDNAYVWQHRDR